MLRGVLVLSCLTGCDTIFLDRSPIEDCPADYQQLESEPTRHRVVAVDSFWPEAAADCADDAPGLTHLAVIDTFTEIDSIHRISPVGRVLWVGYARSLGEPTFTSVLGDPLPDSSSLWNGGEPSNTNGIEYVVELGESGFNDNDLTVKKLYVCECDAKPVKRTFDFTP